MNARPTALRDIKKYLDPIAISDKAQRKHNSGRYLKYANIMKYDSLPEDNFMLRVSHLTDPNINRPNKASKV